MNKGCETAIHRSDYKWLIDVEEMLCFRSDWGNTKEVTIKTLGLGLDSDS